MSLEWHIYYNSSCECNVEPEKWRKSIQYCMRTSEKWLLFKKDLNAKKIQKVTFKVCSSWKKYSYLSWSRLYLAARIRPVVSCLYYTLYPITLSPHNRIPSIQVIYAVLLSTWAPLLEDYCTEIYNIWIHNYNTIQLIKLNTNNI